jgi:16S rRNA (cytosine1402-N4)-methyltransferase
MHQNKTKNKHIEHEPVLLAAVLEYLSPQSDESYLDLTAGYGGHAAAILAKTGQPGKATLVDRDKNAIEYLEQRYGEQLTICHQDFLSASRELIAKGMQFDVILADLGVSSPHLNEGIRGFAFRETGPLDMRMDQRQTLSAETIVNSYSEVQLADILKRYGEEPKARQIAKLIVEHRPLISTSELAALAARAWPGHSRVHPATRTFQALRIAVNDELSLLSQSIPLWLQLLAPNGRLAVISFHSLEDRVVKQAFADVSGERYDADFRLLSKRPILASPHELVSNPRARSAKLRAVVKIKNRKGMPNADSG